MAAGERLPEHHADRPDVARLGRVLAAEPLGRDVGERARDVAHRGERVRLVELRQAEVEEAHRDGLPRLEQHVRRLHVTVDDTVGVRVGQAVEDLRRRLDRLGIRELAGAERLAQGLALDVLVCDVDVSGVGAEVVGAHAAGVAESRCRLGLAGSACLAFPLAADDLERHIEARPLVAGQPDRTRRAATQRPQRPVPAQDQAELGCMRMRRHPAGSSPPPRTVPALADPSPPQLGSLFRRFP